MKKIFALLILVMLAQLSVAQETQQKMDDLVQAYARLGKFNGSILVAENGNILLKKGYGYKNFRQHSLNDANTIFQIGSVTKPFTSTVILKLVELNKISLIDKLSKFYPEFPKGDSITIENLLTHTSGISDHSTDTSFHIYQGSDEKVFIESLKIRNF